MISILLSYLQASGEVLVPCVSLPPVESLHENNHMISSVVNVIVCTIN